MNQVHDRIKALIIQHRTPLTSSTVQREPGLVAIGRQDITRRNVSPDEVQVLSELYHMRARS